MGIWFNGEPDLAALNEEGKGCLHSHIGLEFTGFGEDWLGARLPVDQRTRQPHGLLHGGASVVLAEATASVAGSLTINPALQRALGMEINANHVRHATHGYVHAVARPETLGKRMQVWAIRISDDGGQLVCVSRMTLAVTPQR
jgi:1,4-dihydroxy-2-naphthoyl-CoA hydrolase